MSTRCSRDTGCSNLHFLEKNLRSGYVCSLPSPTTKKRLLRLSSLVHFHAFSYHPTRSRYRFLFRIFIFAFETLLTLPRCFFPVVDESFTTSQPQSNEDCESMGSTAERWCKLPGVRKHLGSQLFLKRRRKAFFSQFSS